MNNSDYAKFAACWSHMSESLNGPNLSDGAIEFAFSILIDFELPEVTGAVLQHCRSETWIATPAHIIAQILGKPPSDESMVGLARDPKSVLGRFLHSVIGGHELQVMRDEPLIMRIKTHKFRIADFIGRAQAGEYSDEEIRMFAGSQIDPTGDLCKGLRGPAREHHESIKRRYQAATVPMMENDHKPRTEKRTEEETKVGKETLAAIMATLNMAPKTKTEQDDELKQNKEQVQVASTSLPKDRTVGREAIERLRKVVK